MEEREDVNQGVEANKARHKMCKDCCYGSVAKHRTDSLPEARRIAKVYRGPNEGEEWGASSWTP